MKTYFVVAIIAGCIAIPAAAQESDNFAGFRIEAVGGYDSIGVSIEEEVLGAEVEESDDGVIYGVGVGYDVALGDSITLGLEAEYSDSSVGSSAVFDDEDIEGVILDGTASLDATQDLYFGGRIGTALSPRALFYVKGGYSMASAEFLATGSIDGETGTIEADAEFDGIRLGGGFEARLTSNFFAKIEYRYTSYTGGDVEYEGTEMNVDEAFDFFDLNRHQVVIGVGARF